MHRTAAEVLTVATTTAALLAAGAAAPALADPPAPAAQDLVGVGADTANALMNRISTDYNAALAAAGDTTSPRLYSWDFTGSATITPKTGAATIARPRGSSDGILALNLNTRATVDFAPSSRPPRYLQDPPSELFVAFAKDAVTWAAKSGGHAPANLTTQALRDIYSCQPWAVDWSAYGGAAGPIRPWLPSPSSGTGAFFLKAIGLSAPGGCVRYGPVENEGTDPVLDDPDAIVPYSAGHWVGQSRGHGSAADAPGALTLRNINGLAPLNGIGAVNASFAASSYGRVLYNVVREAEWRGSGPQTTALRAVFGSTGYLCSVRARVTVVDYGYLSLPSAACGSTVSSETV
ncbi:substrate-binding domain-containing protein [Kitasatospora sp. NPDC088391]|uniref:substrate-binding domain-containing protein n=1 Tax=Kitasatospora sp. NPDC088391 TaxID=3364074 RepID=UPI003812F141